VSAPDSTPGVHGDERTPPTRCAGIAETVETNSAVEWAYSFANAPTARVVCPEQNARDTARLDWAALLWKRVGGGEWVEAKTTRPDGSVS
jgi:hypothetical protein